MSAATETIEGRTYHDALDDVPPPAASTRLTGHDRAMAEVRAIVGSGHHAIMFEGEEGIGKATAAFHLAMALLSGQALGDGSVVDADAATATRRQIAQGAHPNLLHVTRPGNATGTGFRTVITIDEIRRITHFLSMTPSINAPRIVIIDPVGDMQRPAANALLKTLEEPPANTVFVLISHGGGRVLPTIRSRCQKVRFEPLGDDDLRSVLSHVAPQTLQLADPAMLVLLAGGSVRGAITMALHGGIELRQALDALLTAPVFDTAAAHKLADVAGRRGNDIQDTLLKRMVMADLHGRARGAALTARHHEARRLADIATQMAERHRVGAAFGLDRGQELLVGLARLHAMLHKTGRR